MTPWSSVEPRPSKEQARPRQDDVKAAVGGWFAGAVVGWAVRVVTPTVERGVGRPHRTGRPIKPTAPGACNAAVESLPDTCHVAGSLDPLAHTRARTAVGAVPGHLHPHVQRRARRIRQPRHRHRPSQHRLRTTDQPRHQHRDRAVRIDQRPASVLVTGTDPPTLARSHTPAHPPAPHPTRTRASTSASVRVTARQDTPRPANPPSPTASTATPGDTENADADPDNDHAPPTSAEPQPLGHRAAERVGGERAAAPCTDTAWVDRGRSRRGRRSR